MLRVEIVYIEVSRKYNLKHKKQNNQSEHEQIDRKFHNDKEYRDHHKYSHKHCACNISKLAQKVIFQDTPPLSSFFQHF